MASSRICSVAACEKRRHKGDLCSGCAKRLAKWGTLERLRAPLGSQLAWIEAHLNHDEPDCLIWPFYRQPRGITGIVAFRGKKLKAFVVMCTMAHGKRPSPTHEAAHSCGKGHEGCINPQHLRWATREENKADMVLHGTAPRGERSANHKVTADDVREIRRLHGAVGCVTLGRRFGVSKTTIQRIWSRSSWAWLD